MEHRNLQTFPILTTERLNLRQLSEHDAEETFLLRSDSLINRYLDRQPSRTLEDALQFIENIKNNSLSYWGIALKGNEKLIGTISLFDISADQKRCEIGYELLTEYQGQGIMREAAKKIIDYSVQTLGVKTIEAYTQKDNQASASLLKELGFSSTDVVDEKDASVMFFRLNVSQLDQAFSLFDDYNRKSPDHLISKGVTFPTEYFYALQLHEWVKKLDPNASEPLQLASRCQHIGRWQIKRTSYPEGRIGYLTWRSDLSKFHADTASSILRSVGYDESMIEIVREIVLKRNRRNVPDVQTMEDALCLVFLEFQFDDLISKHPQEKIIGILQKTWGKMSQRGKDWALKLEYSATGAELISRALN
jgi:RimJ/RimL family protein N-acetyltransferase